MLIFICGVGLFVERVIVGEVVVVIIFFVIFSIVVLGFESCDVVGIDFNVLLDIFIRDVCFLGVVCRNKMS